MNAKQIPNDAVSKVIDFCDEVGTRMQRLETLKVVNYGESKLPFELRPLNELKIDPSEDPLSQIVLQLVENGYGDILQIHESHPQLLRGWAPPYAKVLDEYNAAQEKLAVQGVVSQDIPTIH